ncbi:MAG: hypothetical protein M1840_004431 [Geoglossum simile]|nr:MAG: hypothetical protein M1840_004431 [Geoglossum simile]
MDITIAQLEREYCPPLDAALVLAILLDYDLTTDPAVNQARTTLDHLKAQAIAEESTGFDPSGTSANFDHPIAVEAGGGGIERARSLGWSRSAETDQTDPSRSHSEPSWGPEGTESDGLGDVQTEYAAELEALDDQGKRAVLKEMFSKLKPFSVENTLRKCQGNFQRTVEELLNRTFFEDAVGEGEERINIRSVDAFAEDSGGNIGTRKNRKRARRRQGHTKGSSASADEPSVANEWERMSKDIQFIASRIHKTTGEVSSAYHANGASLPKTIMAMLSGVDNPTATAEEPFIRQNAFELCQEFPTISSTHAITLIRLTHPSTSAAHELALQLIAKPEDSSPTGRIQIITQYPPIETSSPQPLPLKNQSPQSTTPNAATLTTVSSLKRDTAFAQASAAYRRGKSDPLMAAVASYYGDLGRDHDAAARAYYTAAADALVEAQSSDNMLDLHGVSVKDAVRIAREKVRIWWVGLGERSIGGRASMGLRYKIITGVGRHSEGGKGKIGPAVVKMLMREKWKVEVGAGVVFVTGVR